LDDENVLSADIFADLDEYLHVGKAAHMALRQGCLEIGRDGVSQGPIAIASDQLHGRGSIVTIGSQNGNERASNSALVICKPAGV
jgi:hypothetical protein